MSFKQSYSLFFVEIMDKINRRDSEGIQFIDFIYIVYTIYIYIRTL